MTKHQDQGLECDSFESWLLNKGYKWNTIEKYLKRVGRNSALSRSLREADLLPPEMLLSELSDIESLVRINEWWNSPQVSETFRRDVRNAMNALLSYRGFRQENTGRAQDIRFRRPPSGIRFLNLLQQYRVGCDSRAIECYNVLIEILSGLPNYYNQMGDVNGHSGVYNEEHELFASFWKCADQKRLDEPEKVRECLLEKLKDDRLRKVCKLTAQLPLQDGSSLMHSLMLDLAKRPLAQGNNQLFLLEALDAAAEDSSSDRKTLADRYLSVVWQVLSDSAETEGAAHSVPLKDWPLARPLSLTKRWLESQPDDALLEGLERIEIPSEESPLDTLAASVFCSLLRKADDALGRDSLRCRNCIWELTEERERNPAQEAEKALRRAINYAEQNAAALCRVLPQLRLKWYSPVREILLLPGEIRRSELYGQLLLRHVHLLLDTTDIECSEDEDQRARQLVSIQRAREALRRCDELLEERADSFQLSAELTECDLGLGQKPVWYGMATETALCEAELVLRLAILEREEIWADDAAQIYAAPCREALARAKNTAALSGVDQTLRATLNKRIETLREDCDRAFFSPEGAVYPRLRDRTGSLTAFSREYRCWHPQSDQHPFVPPKPDLSALHIESAATFDSVYCDVFDSVYGRDQKNRKKVQAALIRHLINGRNVMLQMNQFADNRAILDLLLQPGFQTVCRQGMVVVSCYSDANTFQEYLRSALKNPGYEFSSSQCFNDLEGSGQACREKMLAFLDNPRLRPTEFPEETREEMGRMMELFRILFEVIQPADMRRYHQNPAVRWPPCDVRWQAKSLNEVLRDRVDAFVARFQDWNPALAKKLQAYQTAWGSYTKRSEYKARIDAERKTADARELEYLDKFETVVNQSYFLSNGHRSCNRVLLSESDPSMLLTMDAAGNSEEQGAVSYIVRQVHRSAEDAEIGWIDLGERAMVCRRIEREVRERRLPPEQAADKKGKATGLSFTVKQDDVLPDSFTMKTTEGVPMENALVENDIEQSEYVEVHKHGAN